MASFPAALDLGDLDGTDGFRLDGAVEGEPSGFSVSDAGDVNGDGLGDLLVGGGSTYVIFGRAGRGFPAALDLGALDGRDGFRLDGAGGSVSDAGDVNGDGIGDLLIGALGASAAYVVFGRAGGGFPAALDLSGLDGSDGFRLDGAFGVRSVSGAGDVNGDGLDDLLVGAPQAFPGPGGREGAGSSYVVFGREGGGFGAALDLGALDGTDGFRLDGESFRYYSGASVSAAGDVDGDGVGDLLVGTATYGYAEAAYVVFGRAGGGFPAALELGGLDGADGFRLDGNESGGSVSAAGDVNGDGIDDLLVGAPFADPGGRGAAGSSYVVFGREGGGFPKALDLGELDGTDGFRLDGAAAYDSSGFSVSAAGDVNGDGVGDLLVGAPYADPGGREFAGASFVVFGREGGGFPAALDLGELDGTDGFRLDGAAAHDQSGFSVSAAGDVDGDGIDDLLVGAPFADPGGRENAGSTYVVFGRRDDGGGTGPVANPDSARADGARPVRLDPLANDEPGPGGSLVGGPRLASDPAHGTALAADGGTLLYVPDLGFAGADAFDYEVRDAGGDTAVGSVTVAVAGRTATAKGTAGDDALEGGGGDDLLLGLAGGDALRGLGGDDTLVGGRGGDRLFGGEGADALRGGGGRNLLVGGDGADLFLLEAVAGSRAVVRDLDLGAGDALVMADPALLLADGRLAGGRIAAEDAGDALLLRADLDGDGTFEALLARIAGGAGLAAEDVLLNAIA